MKEPITIIDYGMGNIRSVQKAFEHLGACVRLTADPEAVGRAQKLVLPGVGAFGAGMSALRNQGLDSIIVETVKRGVPILGICVGMQFLFERSDELGNHRGLGLLHGQVARLASESGRLKVPHTGWNQIEYDHSHPLLNDVSPGDYAYFVHSYYCIPADSAIILATCHYGRQFSAAVGQGHILGIQFHPEKSQQVGLQILRNYWLGP